MADYSPVFALKDYPVTGMGGYSENVARSAISTLVTIMKSRPEAVRSDVFCDRFFSNQAGAGKWLRVPGGPIDFKKMVDKVPLPNARLEPLGIDNQIAVGAIVIEQDKLTRTVFDTVTDYVNYLNAHAHRFACIPHAVFRVFAKDLGNAVEWSRTYCADGTDDLFNQTVPVLEWR